LCLNPHTLSLHHRRPCPRWISGWLSCLPGQTYWSPERRWRCQQTVAACIDPQFPDIVNHVFCYIYSHILSKWMNLPKCICVYYILLV
jgi:hypothetical protein